VHDGHNQPDEQRDEVLFPSAEAAHHAADRLRQHASGPLFVVQVAPGGEAGGWLVLTAEEMASHPRRADFGSAGTVAPPLAAAATVEVTVMVPGTQHLLSLGTMDPAGAMSLVDLMQNAGGMVLQPEQPGEGGRDRLPAPTGYMVLMDAARPGHLTVRLTFTHRSFADVQAGLEDLGMPGGDTHSGPASLVVVLDHWAEEHGYRFVHTAEELNQPIEEFLDALDPDERQRVVIAVEEDDEGGIVRIGEAVEGSAEIVEVAALSTDWLASLPRAM